MAFSLDVIALKHLYSQSSLGHCWQSSPVIDARHTFCFAQPAGAAECQRLYSPLSIHWQPSQVNAEMQTDGSLQEQQGCHALLPFCLGLESASTCSRIMELRDPHT